MWKSLTKTVIKRFARQTDLMKKKEIQEQMPEIREYIQKQRHERYLLQDTDKYQHKVKKLGLFGNSQSIIGAAQDHKSVQLVLSVLEEFLPKVLLLGGMSRADFEEIKQGEQYFEKPLQIFNQENDILAKEKLAVYFERQMETEFRHFIVPNDHIVYSIDKEYKKIILENELTAAKKYCDAPGTIIFFGKPDINLVLEDLALRFDLKHLKEMFNHTMSTSIENLQKDRKPECYFDNQSVLESLKKTARELYNEVLFEKQLIYSVSLFKKAMKLFKDASLILPQQFVDYSEKLALMEVLPEYDMIFRQTSELNFQQKYNFKQKKVKRYFKDDVNKEELLQKLKINSEKYAYASQEAHLFQNISKTNRKELTEKFVILSYLVDNSQRQFLNNNQNPFSETIFKEVYQNTQLEEIKSEYFSILKPYQIEMHQFQNEIIRHLKHPSISVGRQKVQSFKQQIESVYQYKTFFDYKIQIGMRSRKKNVMILGNLIFNKALEIIDRRQTIQQIPQQQEIFSLRCILNKEEMSELEIHTLHKLAMEANLELGGIVKFPKKLFQQYIPYVANLQKKYFLERIEKQMQILEKVAFPQISNEIKQNKRLENQNSKESGNGSNQGEQEEEQGQVERLSENMFVINRDPNEKLPYEFINMSHQDFIDEGAQLVNDSMIEIDPSSSKIVRSNLKQDELLEVQKDIQDFLTEKPKRNRY